MKDHWHSVDQEYSQILHTENTFWPGNFKFKPEYWTLWLRKLSERKQAKITHPFVVRDEDLYRNVCSAVLDAEKLFEISYIRNHYKSAAFNIIKARYTKGGIPFKTLRDDDNGMPLMGIWNFSSFPQDFACEVHNSVPTIRRRHDIM